MQVPVPLLLLLMTKNIQSTDQRLIADQKERKIPALTASANEQTNISRKKKKKLLCVPVHACMCLWEKEREKDTRSDIISITKERIQTEEADRHKRKERQREWRQSKWEQRVGKEETGKNLLTIKAAQWSTVTLFSCLNQSFTKTNYKNRYNEK